jgi:hypothetical protein
MSVRPAYVVAARVGVAIGLGAYTFRYAEGLSVPAGGRPPRSPPDDRGRP